MPSGRRQFRKTFTRPNERLARSESTSHQLTAASKIPTLKSAWQLPSPQELPWQLPSSRDSLGDQPLRVSFLGNCTFAELSSRKLSLQLPSHGSFLAGVFLRSFLRHTFLRGINDCLSNGVFNDFLADSFVQGLPDSNFNLLTVFRAYALC